MSRCVFNYDIENRVPIMEVRSLNEYYNRLHRNISESILWRSLQGKSEYDLKESERGYKSLAVSLAGKIAKELNLNSVLAEILTMCKASFFTECGQEGKKCVFEYFNNHQINITEAEFARFYIKKGLWESGVVIAPEFDDLLKKMFDYNTSNDIPEIQIAKICCDLFDLIKYADLISKTELLEIMPKKVLSACTETGAPVGSEILKELCCFPLKRKTIISEEDKNRIFNTIDESVSYEGDVLEGVYEFFL